MKHLKNFNEGLIGINVNGNLCDCSVGSEGGNKDTFLIIK